MKCCLRQYNDLNCSREGYLSKQNLEAWVKTQLPDDCEEEFPEFYTECKQTLERGLLMYRDYKVAGYWHIGQSYTKKAAYTGPMCPNDDRMMIDNSQLLQINFAPVWKCALPNTLTLPADEGYIGSMADWHTPLLRKGALATDVWAKQDFFQDETMTNYSKTDKLVQIALNIRVGNHLKDILTAMQGPFNAMQIMRFIKQHETGLEKFMLLFGHLNVYLPARWAYFKAADESQYVAEFGRQLEGYDDDTFYRDRFVPGNVVRAHYPYPGAAEHWPDRLLYKEADGKTNIIRIGIKVQENLNQLDHIEQKLCLRTAAHAEQYGHAKAYWKELLEDKQKFLEYLPFVETFLKYDARMPGTKSYTDRSVSINDWPLGPQIEKFMKDLNIPVAAGVKKGEHRFKDMGSYQAAGNILNYVNLRHMCHYFKTKLNEKVITGELRALLNGNERYQLWNLPGVHTYLNRCRHGRVVDAWPGRPLNSHEAPARYADFDKFCVPFIDRNTFCNYDLLSVMEANVDADMPEDMQQNMQQNMQENVHEQMHADMSEVLPAGPAQLNAQLNAQQVTSSAENDASMEQPKKRGRPSKQKEKETALSQIELDQISASVDQEMESIFQSVTTAKPLQKQ